MVFDSDHLNTFFLDAWPTFAIGVADRSHGPIDGYFEERVSKSLNKLGVPSAKDVDALVKRIDALSAQVDKLSKPARTAASRANGVVKPAAKRASARKSAA